MRGFLHFVVVVCLFLRVHSSEGEQEASSPFEILMATVGRTVFLSFEVCVWEERAELCLVGLFL